LPRQGLPGWVSAIVVGRPAGAASQHRMAL